MSSGFVGVWATLPIFGQIFYRESVGVTVIEGACCIGLRIRVGFRLYNLLSLAYWDALRTIQYKTEKDTWEPGGKVTLFWSASRRR